MSRESRALRLRERLIAELRPVAIEVEDQSHLHAGHAGAAGGASHFRVRIVTDSFRGKSILARHRMVYAAAGEMMRNEIHALTIEASEPANSGCPPA